MGAICACGRQSQDQARAVYEPLEPAREAGELELKAEESNPTETKPEGGTTEGSKSDDDDPGPVFKVACCCCCCLLYIAMIIPGVILARGFTECPDPGETSNGTEVLLPNWQIMETPKFQWTSWFGGAEMNVFDPHVSNTSRMGYWRTVRTPLLQTQFAYVPEGSEVPQVVVTVPFFSWTTTYNVELCPTLDKWKVSQDYFVWGGWFQKAHEYSIFDEPGETLIAKTRHLKDLTFGFHGWNPPGWKAVVKSEVENDKDIGAIVQDVHSFFADGWTSAKSTWMVVDKQPELLSPTVLSFLAATYDLTKDDDDD
mmetsp:Transcript_124976/g.233758  ORF Transcript_124976/g.233758 Transcript_124976/m.233758 type:complete len:312 (+) Transcript_124976:89-1024(+)